MGEREIPMSLRWLAVPAVALAFLEGAPASAGDRQQAAAAYVEANRLYDQGHFAEAAAAYTRALEQDPEYPEALHNRALANEMVDAQAALKDWRRFVEAAGAREQFKWDVARARARLQMLESRPALPDSMSPGHYVAEAGDYYWSIAESSEGQEWESLPVKVFLGSAPEIKWQAGTREAFDIWKAVFPLELEALPQNADIRMAWERATREGGHAGEEMDWVQIRRVGGELTGRKVAIIAVDLSRNWSKDEMRAIIVHEMGHALGIKGHSPRAKDIMYWQMQEKYHQIAAPGIPLPIYWKSLVKQPSQCDLNTLIRIYNSPGAGKRFP